MRRRRTGKVAALLRTLRLRVEELTQGYAGTKQRGWGLNSGSPESLQSLRLQTQRPPQRWGSCGAPGAQGRLLLCPGLLQPLPEGPLCGRAQGVLAAVGARLQASTPHNQSWCQ